MTVEQIWDKVQQIIGLIGVIGIAYTPIATLIAARVPRPPASSPRWKRWAYDLFVDVPSWCAAVGRIGIFGGKASMPLVPSRQPDSNPPVVKKNGAEL